VLEHLAEHGRVEGRILEGKRLDRRLAHRPAHACAQDLDSGRCCVDARHLEAELLQALRERALTGAYVEHALAGPCFQEELEQQPLAQLMP
jgi:hypothetical protein